MAKINQEEYELLKKLDDNWKWIARDGNGRLYKFLEKPKKVNGFQWNDREQTWLRMSGDSFQFIQWEDEEPYNIQELIEGYEENQAYEIINRQFESLYGESEETEVKNIEWAIKEIESLETEESQNYPHDEMIEKEIVLGILNQLDEPEVLSQELPVIPKFVADWIERFVERYDLYPALKHLENHFLDWKDVYKWYRKNTFKFVYAYLTKEYEVEKQPQYRLKAGKNYLYFNLDGTVRGATKDNATITNERLEKLPFDVEKAVESGIIEVEELEE